MRQVIFLAGLPASGKSNQLKQMDTDGFRIFDDYKKDAINDDSSFQCSQHFDELIASIKDGVPCAVSDIDFCRTNSREEAEYWVKKLVEDINIKWWFFENDPEQCIINARQRAPRENRNIDTEIVNIQRYSKEYSIPENAEIIPVWRP